MTALSWILIALISVLIAAIVILEVTKPKKKPSRPVELGITQTVSTTNSTNIVVPAAKNTTETVPDWSLQAQVTALKQKNELLVRRVQRVETILGQMPLNRLQKELDLAALEQKIDRLIESKNELQIEIAALRDQINQTGRLEKTINWNPSQTKAFEEKIRALAFNSRLTQKNKR